MIMTGSKTLRDVIIYPAMREAEGQSAPPRPYASPRLTPDRQRHAPDLAARVTFPVSARSSVVNGSLRGAKERRSFKPKVAGSTPVGRIVKVLANRKTQRSGQKNGRSPRALGGHRTNAASRPNTLSKSLKTPAPFVADPLRPLPPSAATVWAGQRTPPQISCLHIQQLRSDLACLHVVAKLSSKMVGRKWAARVQQVDQGFVGDWHSAQPKCVLDS